MAWGTGQAMAQQSCPYKAQAGEGASSYLEDYNELKKAKSDEEAKLREMKRKLRTLEKSKDKARDAITNVVDGKYSDAVLTHMDNARLCGDYDTDKIPKTKSKAQGDDDGESIAPANNAQTSLTPLSGFNSQQWAQVCIQGKKGGIDGMVCSTAPYASADRGRYTPNECKRSLESYRKDTLDYQKTQEDIAKSEDRIARYKDELPEVLRDAKARYKEDRQAGTEGDICLTCMAGGSSYQSERSSPDWAGVAANVGVGLVAMYAGYQNNKMVAQYNSDLGWPTQAYPTWGYGLPFIANGLYGALGGGMGSGGYGCAGGIGGGGYMNGTMGGMGPFGQGGGLYGNVGMNGPFGYPNGMMGGGQGGGMYNGGMGPWGLNGMPGMGMGGGMPGMGGGLMASGGIGMMAGGGYPGMGGMGMGGYPMGGGLMASGGIGMMAGGGYPGMGGMGMGGYPMGGGLMASGGIGMMAGGGYPGMGGMGMGGYPMGGGMGAMGMGGYPMGGGMGAMGMGGYPGMGGMGMDGGLGSMQMQQAMLQMQQQQQQLYMQQYQQQMQNQMARQQTMVGLQSELQNLMYRIQQVQMGGTATGYISGGIGGGVSIGGGVGIGGGTLPPGVLPAPGTSGTTIPAGVVIPAGSR
jgi:hypothetical protein